MEDMDELENNFSCLTRSDILQGQALFRGAKQLLTILENLAFLLLKKRWIKDRQTDKQKEKKTKNKETKEK